MLAGAYWAVMSGMFIEAGGAGIHLNGALSAPVAHGDSVVATGVLRQDQGANVLEVETYRVVPATPKILMPVPFHPGQGGTEAFEGRLVEIEGRVIGLNAIPIGQALSLLVDGAHFTLIFFSSRPDHATFDDVPMGARVRVTGIVGQFDREAPYDSGYQLYPRTLSDIRTVDVAVDTWRRLVLVLAVLVLLGAAWVWSLRQQVRRRVAERLATEARYRLLFNTVDDAVLVLDQSEKEWTLLEVNDEVLRLTGFTREEVMDLPLRNLVLDDAASREHITLLRTAGRATHSIHFRCKDGSLLPVEMRAQTLTVGDRQLVVSTARDARARVAHERGIEEARARAEDLARLQSSFVANMSHELRTPLAGMIGFAEVLQAELKGEHAEFASIIAQGGHRLLDTLNAVLDLARLDAHGYAVHAREVDAAREVQNALTLLGPLVSRKDIDFTWDVPAEPLPIVIDTTALDRIVHNLVGNAFKFTDCGHIHVTLRPEGKGIELTVADTGVGMTAEFQEKLFQPFTQESHGLSRSHEGVGLGLSLTQRLVTLLQGTIAVTSEKNSGTTFTVWLPSLGEVACPEIAQPAEMSAST